ncbi:MAG: lipoprotein insertase outer membrane protein LolB [Pseudomonadota bacterium]
MWLTVPLSRSLPTLGFPAIKKILLVACCLVLTACQSLPEILDDDSQTGWLRQPDAFADRQNDLAGYSVWEYRAKGAITADNKSEQINILWQYADQGHAIRMFGPLGMGNVLVQYDEYSVRISDNKGLRYQGRDVSDLLQEVTGLVLPIGALEYWLFAVPDPDAVFEYKLASNESGDTSRISDLRQLGWTLEFEDYREWRQDLLLPRKITARKDDPELGLIKIKLIAKNWQIGSE